MLRPFLSPFLREILGRRLGQGAGSEGRKRIPHLFSCEELATCWSYPRTAPGWCSRVREAVRQRFVFEVAGGRRGYSVTFLTVVARQGKDNRIPGRGSFLGFPRLIRVKTGENNP